MWPSVYLGNYCTVLHFQSTFNQQLRKLRKLNAVRAINACVNIVCLNYNPNLYLVISVEWCHQIGNVFFWSVVLTVTLVCNKSFIVIKDNVINFNYLKKERSLLDSKYLARSNPQNSGINSHIAKFKQVFMEQWLILVLLFKEMWAFLLNVIIISSKITIKIELPRSIFDSSRLS